MSRPNKRPRPNRSLNNTNLPTNSGLPQTAQNQHRLSHMRTQISSNPPMNHQLPAYGAAQISFHPSGNPQSFNQASHPYLPAMAQSQPTYSPNNPYEYGQSQGIEQSRPTYLPTISNIPGFVQRQGHAHTMADAPAHGLPYLIWAFPPRGLVGKCSRVIIRF